MTDQSIGLPATPDIAKAQAKRLRSALAPDLTIGHSQALELIARVHGEQSWGRLNSQIGAATNVISVIGNANGNAPAEAVPEGARTEAAGSKLRLRTMSSSVPFRRSGTDSSAPETPKPLPRRTPRPRRC